MIIGARAFQIPRVDVGTLCRAVNGSIVTRLLLCLSNGYSTNYLDNDDENRETSPSLTANSSFLGHSHAVAQVRIRL